VRCGHALVVGRRGVAAGAGSTESASGDEGLPYARLVIDAKANSAMTPAVLASLEKALLLEPEDLLATFVAGRREIDALRGSLGPADPWIEGGLALRQPAPELVARGLTRGFLFSQLQVVELSVDAGVVGREPPFAALYPFLGIETDLPEQWRAPEALVRSRNTVAQFLGEMGVYRDASRRMVFEREGARLTVTEQLRSVAGPQTLTDSINAFWSDDVRRNGTSVVHGHLAYWLYAEPANGPQRVVMTWHCPYQGRLYLAEHEVTDGKPGQFEEPLRFLGTHVRCAHPRRGAPAESEEGEAPGPEEAEVEIP
jgi:hypothetical protein